MVQQAHHKLDFRNLKTSDLLKQNDIKINKSKRSDIGLRKFEKNKDSKIWLPGSEFGFREPIVKSNYPFPKSQILNHAFGNLEIEK